MPTRIDTASAHTTSSGGNIFEDLGFSKEEAAKLKARSDQEIDRKKRSSFRYTRHAGRPEAGNIEC